MNEYDEAGIQTGILEIDLIFIEFKVKRTTMSIKKKHCNLFHIKDLKICLHMTKQSLYSLLNIFISLTEMY